MHVMRKPGRRLPEASLALWLDLEQTPKPRSGQPVHAWWWLPPVIWPGDQNKMQALVADALKKGWVIFLISFFR